MKRLILLFLLLPAIAHGTIIFNGIEADPQVDAVTSGKICEGSGTQVTCDLDTDASGDCASGDVCMGGHSHLTDNAATATALAANGANCTVAGKVAVGVDASGVAEDCQFYVGNKAAGAPTANDDTNSSPAFAVGDEWIDTTTGCKHIAKSVADGNAVWVNQCRPPLQENYFLVGGSSGYAEATNVLPLTSISDTVYFADNDTPTKKMQFQLSGLSVATRTLTPQDKDYTIGNANVTISSDADGMDGTAMLAAGMYGTLFIATGSGTWTLPTAVEGMSACLVDSGTNHDLILDVQAGDDIQLKGTEQANGLGITNAATSTTGDFVCVIAISAGHWITLNMGGVWVSQ